MPIAQDPTVNLKDETHYPSQFNYGEFIYDTFKLTGKKKYCMVLEGGNIVIVCYEVHIKVLTLINY